MRALLRVLIAVLAVLWVGGVAFLPIVAATAFKALPSVNIAGLLVRNVLQALHIEGLVLGSALLVLIAFAGIVKAYGREVIGPLLCVVSMLLLTAWSQFVIIPPMEKDRLAVGGDIAAASPQDPRRLEFNRLHRASEQVEEGVLFTGVLMVALLARAPKPAPRLPLDRTAAS